MPFAASPAARGGAWRNTWASHASSDIPTLHDLQINAAHARPRSADSRTLQFVQENKDFHALTATVSNFSPDDDSSL